MPEPGGDPQWPMVRRVAVVAIVGGGVLSALKFGLYLLSNSAAVLSDALESLVNIAAAGVMLYSLTLANRPPDREHRYGHGKAQFMAIAFEGGAILFAGAAIAVEAGRRLFEPEPLRRLDLTAGLLAGVALLVAALGGYIYMKGAALQNRVLLADAKHILTDVATTFGALLGVGLVRLTGWAAVDSIAAIALAALIVVTGGRLLAESFAGLMDRADERDLALVRGLLQEEVEGGEIRGFHKVRVRRTGGFAWADMHAQVEPEMNVSRAHEIASRIEGRIERALGEANATIHVEPAEEESPSETPRPG